MLFYHEYTESCTRALRFCFKAETTYPLPDPLDGAENMEYYGQRPWRQGHQSN